MISAEDRLCVYAVVQAEFGKLDLAEVLCKFVEAFGLDRALLELNRVLADPRVQADRPAS